MLYSFLWEASVSHFSSVAYLGCKRKKHVSNRTQFVLGDINSQAELFASSDVEAQAVVV